MEFPWFPFGFRAKPHLWKDAKNFFFLLHFLYRLCYNNHGGRDNLHDSYAKWNPQGVVVPRGSLLYLPLRCSLIHTQMQSVITPARIDTINATSTSFTTATSFLCLISQIGEGQHKYHTIIRQNPQAAGHLNFPCLINIILLRIKRGGSLLQNGILRYAPMKKIVENAVGTIDGHRRLC